MFSKPRTISYVAPEEPIDANEKYILRLLEIKDEGVSTFADPAEPDPAHNLSWTFQMFHMDKTPILNVDGDVYEHRDYTSNRTGKGKRPAKARLWIEALLGRTVEDSEIDDSLPNMLKDKAAIALFEEVAKEDSSGQEYMKLKILRLAPYKGGTSSEPAAEPVAAKASAPAPKREPVAAGKDLPW